MIEFAILFGLGFLTAALAGLLLAPIVFKRIIWFTENRLRATTPLSPQEVRAQKDMVRALYAAENAKVGQDLIREREKAVNLQISADALAREASRLQAENADLQSQINDMNVEAADMRSELRRENELSLQMKLKLGETEAVISGKDQEIDTLQKRLNKLASDIDNLKIDLAASGTLAESMQSRIASLRDDRDSLRHDMKLMTQRAKDAEMRLAKEEHKALRLEERLIREQMLSTDRESMLERRAQDNARLKEKLKKANAEAREAARGSRQSGGEISVTSLRSRPSRHANERQSQQTGIESDSVRPIELPGDPALAAERVDELAEDLRGYSTVVAERLLRAKTAAQDAALRDDIATIAARMVALTAMSEGAASPIPAILAAEPPKANGSRQSLADRIADSVAFDS